jgi:hypothetical protein
MSKLTSKERGKLPKADFGQPAARKYPMPDKKHAANAKARASQQSAAGHLDAAQKAMIDAKADRVLSGK